MKLLKSYQLTTYLRAALLFTGLATGVATQASTVTYTLPDLLTSASYAQANTGQTFSGTGFVGMFSDWWTPPNGEFGHLLGLEGNFSRTVMQVNISALKGSHIRSATLGLDLLKQQIPISSLSTITVTGFATGGALGYTFDAPAPVFGQTSSRQVPLRQSFNVTTLLQSALDADEQWLGLHLENSQMSAWTWTFSGIGHNADSAKVRLMVDYVHPVPEPASLALVLLASLGVWAGRRSAQGRRQTTAIGTAEGAELRVR